MKKPLCVVLSALMLTLSLCSCRSESKTTDEMFALDTIITFTIYDDEKTAKSTIEKCKNEIVRLENMLSATKENTDVYNINHSNGESVTVADETAKLLRKSKTLSQNTNGAFDVSIYPVVKLWGFDTKEYKVPNDSEIKETLKYVGFESIAVDENSVTLKNGMSIDLGAVAKGYIAERIYYIMESQNVSRGIVNLGGMVVTYNSNESSGDFTIGVEYPDTGEIFATFKTSEKFTVTSGAYQRYFEENGKRYHHIIDPKSGKPSVSDISSVTIITDDGVSGDALSTAFFVMGVDKMMEYINTREDDYSFIILNSNKNEVYISSDLAKNGFELEKKFEGIKVINCGFDTY